MNNNGMIEYKESFISKIRNFFINIFGKQKVEIQNTQIEEIKYEDVLKEEVQEKNFLREIKVDTKEIDKAAKKRAFLEKVDGNIEELKKLSVEELRKLETYYDSVIMENEKIIKSLKELV